MKYALLALLFAASTACAQIKISELPAASTLTGTEATMVTQGGVSKKATITQINAYTLTSTGTLTGKTISGANNTLSNVAFGVLTGLPTTLAGHGITDGLLAATAASTYATITNLNLKAPIDSPTFTGTVTGPTFVGALTGNASTVTTNANLTGPVTSVGNATAIANGAISNAMLANAAVANLSGTNTGDQTTITGNAGTATALQTARTINGTSFDGTGNITITAAAGTLTGTTLASNVVTSSLTSLGTIATGVWQGTAVADSYIASAATWNAKLAPAGNGSSLTALNASELTSGTVAAARMPALTGDVTTSAGAVATTIANGAVTNAKLAGSIDLTTKVTGILPPANMGTGSSITTKYLRGDGTWQTISGGGDALVSGSLDQFADVTQTATKTFAITESTTLAGGTHSGTNTGDQTTITGNAGTATALQTGRTINGTTFDGTANITIAAAAGTLTGTTLASGVTASSLTSVGTIATGAWQGTAVADSYVASAATWNAKQAGDADLTTYAGITPSANVQTLLGAADYLAIRTLLGLGTLATQSATISDYLTTASAASTYQPLDPDLTDLADGSLTGTLVAAATTSARGSVELATDGETAASVAVQGSDARLVSATKVEIGIALSDETSDNTASSTVPKVTFRMPFAMTITSLRCSLTKSSTGAILIVDMHEAGTTVMTTNKLSVDASETTSTTAATAHTLTDTALADDALIELFIDQVGTTTDNTGEGVKVWLIGTR